MAGSIICGVDDSVSAEGAARFARALADKLDLGVVFVRVVEPDFPGAKVRGIPERLEWLRTGATDSEAAWVVDASHPADGLIAAAALAEASMIVVGSRGPHSSPLGSISADVSRRAACPVVVVPPGAAAQVDGDRRRAEADASNRDFAGGIARFGLGGGSRELAGGIARFGLASRGRTG